MRTSLIVDLAKIKSNIFNLRTIIRPGTKFLAVIKADGYGHGAIAVANVAKETGADYLGVATVQEAIELREAGISTPILILTELTDYGFLQSVLYYNITLTVYTKAFIEAVSQISTQYKKQLKVHLKVDTGMSRVGVEPSEVLAFTKQITNSKYLLLEGLFTHLSDADNSDRNYTQGQLQKFGEVLKDLEHKNIQIPLIHAANSAATINYPAAHFDMVRVGIALYKGVLTFKTKIIFLRHIKEDTAVGYNTNYIARKNMQVAVLSVGYADGYSRLLSNNGQVIIKGRRCDIIGNVCMDMTLVEIPDDLRVQIGDEATLIGTQQQETITAAEVALLTQTIDYEVMCSIGKRVPRLYYR